MKLKTKDDALRDLERNGGLKVHSPNAPMGTEFAGFHQFRTDEAKPENQSGRGAYGSFEVFHYDADRPRLGGLDNDQEFSPGWYWWPCFPGCLPDGEPSGPFPTAEGAFLDAIGD